MPFQLTLSVDLLLRYLALLSLSSLVPCAQGARIGMMFCKTVIKFRYEGAALSAMPLKSFCLGAGTGCEAFFENCDFSQELCSVSDTDLELES